MARGHFTALVTSRRGPSFAEPFARFGVSARFVPPDQLIDVLRLGSASPIIAEAIIIDATYGDPAAGRMYFASHIAQAVRGLPEHTTMQNGIRWRKIPIIIAAENGDVVK